MRFAAALSGVMDRKRHLESGSCHGMGDVVHLQQLWGSALSSEKRDFLRIPQVTAWVSEEEGGAAEERGQFLCAQAELLLSSLSKLCSRVIKVLPLAWQCFPRCLRMWPPHWHPPQDSPVPALPLLLPRAGRWCQSRGMSLGDALRGHRVSVHRCSATSTARCHSQTTLSQFGVCCPVFPFVTGAVTASPLFHLA